MTSKDQKRTGAAARVVRTKAAKSFTCKYPECRSKGFKTLPSKQRHEREQHGADKQCEYCDFTAKRQYQIVQHIEMAHPERYGDTPNPYKEQDILQC
jgi:hypothetical protein